MRSLVWTILAMIMILHEIIEGNLNKKRIRLIDWTTFGIINTFLKIIEGILNKKNQIISLNYSSHDNDSSL